MARIYPDDFDPEMPGRPAGNQPSDPVLFRRWAYDIGHELNLLVDDIEAGRFGPDAQQGRFIQYVRGIKAQWPK